MDPWCVGRLGSSFSKFGVHGGGVKVVDAAQLQNKFIWHHLCLVVMFFNTARCL